MKHTINKEVESLLYVFAVFKSVR